MTVATGSLALILHAHLPFVRHPEHENFLEEDWLFEAITETYLPLLRMMRGLADDGVTFVHVSHQGGPENPLQMLPAFAEFQRELQERCAEPPAPSEATVVGSYGWPS